MATMQGSCSAAGWLARWVGASGFVLALGCGSSSGGGGGGAGGEGEGGAVTYPATDSTTTCKATVTQGAMSGMLAGATCEYLGIPYGAPPTGQLRFMPPQPAAAWSAPLDATKYGPSCLQATTGLGGAGTTSEDCLSLNVFTPKEAPPGPLPVMVFIYGGAFTSGSSSLYSGQPLSEKGPVVVVTMNYRLGALGFLALPELDAQRMGAPSGSDGIRDQQLALKWVQGNIATFHGDPANVTVFGESAGGTSTCMHIVSPGSQGLANRYIIESGLCFGHAPEYMTQAQAYQVGAELAAGICAGDAGAGDGGAFDASGPDVLPCLRAADATAVVTWTPPPGAPAVGTPNAVLGNLLGPPFSPTVEGPGGVLPDTPANLIASGAYNKTADVLAGTNENEWGLFVSLASNPTFGGSSSSPLNITTVAELDKGITALYGSGASQVEAEYATGITDSMAAQVSIDMGTDYTFRCPARDLARAMLAGGTPHYYLYSYNIGPAWHSFELVPLFNETELVALLGAANPSKGFTEEMLGYWTRFAATGNPNAPGDSGAPAWPAYAAASDQELELLDPTPMAAAHVRQAQCNFWASYTQ